MSMCARPSRCAINRDELTSTVLKDTAVPAKSILAPSYPGFQQKIADEAKFDPATAKAEIAKAGFPDGKGFPPIEIWYREQGGYNAAIAGADAAVPAGAVQDRSSASTWASSPCRPRIGPLPSRPRATICSSRPTSTTISIRRTSTICSRPADVTTTPIPDYDAAVNAGDAEADWNKRLTDYAKAEQVLIDKAPLVPLVHPVTIAAVSDKLKGEGVTPNSQGFTPLDRLAGYLYTHITKQ